MWPKFKRVLRSGLIALGVLIAAASLGLVCILQFWPTDDFKFLGGRNPVIAGMRPPIQVCFANPPHERWAQEYRIYSWKQSFETAAKAAERELLALGFRRIPARSAKEDWLDFENEKRDVVWIQPGPSHTRREALGGKGSKDPRWVTVLISQEAPRNWITHVRIAFEPHDY